MSINQLSRSHRHLQQFSFIQDFVLGGICSSIPQTIFAPFIYVRQQLFNIRYRKNISPRPYTSFSDCAINIIKNKGFFTLWKGNFKNILHYFPNHALNLSLNSYFQRIFLNKHNNQSQQKSNSSLINIHGIGDNLISGAMAGLLSMFITYPLNQINRGYKQWCTIINRNKQKQLNNNHTINNNNTNFKQYYYEHILTNLNNKSVSYYSRVYTLQLIGASIYRALYFGLFYSIYYNQLPIPYCQGLFYNFLVAWTCAITAYFISYPIQTIKTRLTLINHYGQTLQQKPEILSIIKKISSQNNWKLFYQYNPSQKLILSITRSFNTAIILTLYSKFHTMLHQNTYSQKES